MCGVVRRALQVNRCVESKWEGSGRRTQIYDRARSKVQLRPPQAGLWCRRRHWVQGEAQTCKWGKYWCDRVGIFAYHHNIKSPCSFISPPLINCQQWRYLTLIWSQLKRRLNPRRRCLHSNLLWTQPGSVAFWGNFFHRDHSNRRSLASTSLCFISGLRQRVKLLTHGATPKPLHIPIDGRSTPLRVALPYTPGEGLWERTRRAAVWSSRRFSSSTALLLCSSIKTRLRGSLLAVWLRRKRETDGGLFMDGAAESSSHLSPFKWFLLFLVRARGVSIWQKILKFGFNLHRENNPPPIEKQTSPARSEQEVGRH